MLPSRLLFLLLFHFVLITGYSQGRRITVLPEKYCLEIPEVWKRPKPFRAITNILPAAVRELNGRMFCTDCKGGYTVRLKIEEPETLAEQIRDETAQKKQNTHNYVLTYRFRAALSVYDSVEKEIVEVLLVDPETTFTFKKEFSVGVQEYRDEIRDREGRLVRTSVKRDFGNPADFVAEHKKEFRPTLADLMGIAEQKMYQIEKLLEKVSD